MSPTTHNRTPTTRAAVAQGIILMVLSLSLSFALPHADARETGGSSRRLATSHETPPASGTPMPTAPTSSAPRRTTLVNPLGSANIKTLVGRAIRGFMMLSGSFALLMFVYGAFLWVTSAGNMEKVKKGKQVFTWATIGLIVIFGSYAFLKAFLDALGGA